MRIWVCSPLSSHWRHESFFIYFSHSLPKKKQSLCVFFLIFFSLSLSLLDGFNVPLCHGFISQTFCFLSALFFNCVCVWNPSRAWNFFLCCRWIWVWIYHNNERVNIFIWYVKQTVTMNRKKRVCFPI